MIWRIRYAKSFYKELAKLPPKTRLQVEEFVFGDGVKENPFATRKLEKLVGYSDYYKARFGVYRVGLRIDSTEQIIEFRRVRHRRDIYRKFP
ncbi:MAG: type II toxin-antitoxin system RelE/ParE family toxin [Cyanobacteria bacterium P01_F01_bin.150]